jgi:CBS domain-containing protein
MPIVDYCRRNPCTATVGESVREATRRMDARGVGCVVVIDAENRPIGMLTDRDVVMKVLRRRRDPDATTVGEVMQGEELSSVPSDAGVERAVRRMHVDGVRRIPVVDADGRLIGIFASDDAVQLLSSELAGLAEAMRAQFPADLEAGHALAAKGE